MLARHNLDSNMEENIQNQHASAHLRRLEFTLMFFVMQFFTGTVIAQKSYVWNNDVLYGINIEAEYPISLLTPKRTYTIMEAFVAGVDYDMQSTTLNIPNQIEDNGNNYNVQAIWYKALEGSPFIKVSYPCSHVMEKAFMNSKHLTEVTMPHIYRHLGDSAFMGCEKLEKINFIDVYTGGSLGFFSSFKGYEKRCFAGCKSLKTFDFGNIKTENDQSSLSIYDYAFENCTGLEEIFFSDENIRFSISDSAFTGCAALKDIWITQGYTPSSLTINDHSFDDETFENAILHVPDNMVSKFKQSKWGKFVHIDGINCVEFSDTYAEEICLANWDTNGDGLFSMEEAAAVTSLGDVFENKSFTSFDELKYFVNLKEINAYAFSGCDCLKSISFPDGLESIRSHAFAGCSNLSSVTFPSSLKTIISQSFIGCNRLQEVISLAPTPIYLSTMYVGEYYFEESIYSTATLYVPAGSKAAYQAAEVWKNFQNIVEMGPSDPIIQFADAEVKRICVENWDTDGDGELSEREAAEVTDLNGVFKMNASITSFNELKYFTGLTTIPDYSFNPCSALRQISIPEGVETIGYGAMAQCDKLEIVELPTSLKTLGDFALYDCPALKQIVLPDNLVNIGIAAFADCTSLQDISVPAGVTMMADAVLSGCTSLGSVNLSSSLVEVGPYAFADCVSLQDIGIPAGVTKIAEGAFWGCTSLGSANLPSTLVEVGQEAFADCVSLRSIDIPNGVETISRLAFSSCTNLSNVTLPATLKVIDDGAFAGSGLKQVALPSTLETIGMQAFGRCVNLTALSIPANVSSIGYEIVGKCRNLKILTVATENQYFRSSGNAIINRTTNKLVQACPTTVIPTDIVGIEEQGFAMTDGLEEIVIPENIKSIGMSAFEECKDLKRVTIPAGIQSIGKDAFLECAGLEQVTVLSPVPVTIEDNVFHMTEIWSEDLTESTTSDFTSATLYVPKGSKAKYQAADGWKNFQNIVEIDVPTGIALPATVERFDVYSPC